LYPSCRKKGFETLASSAVVLKEGKPTIERGKHRKMPDRFVPNDHQTSLGHMLRLNSYMGLHHQIAEQNTTRSQHTLHQIVKQNGYIKQQLQQDYERSKSQNVKLCPCALHSDSTQRKEQCPGRRRSMINRGESLKHACSTKEKIKSTLEAHA
jgi:hypothetical protein